MIDTVKHDPLVDPQVGDKVTSRNGKYRTVTQRDGEALQFVTYSGECVNSTLESWQNWCRAVVER